MTVEKSSSFYRSSQKKTEICVPSADFGDAAATVEPDGLVGRNAEDMHNKLLSDIPDSGFRLLVRQVR